MKLFDWLKGVWNSMFKPSTIQEVLKVTPAISEDMKEKIELWEQMYKGEADWSLIGAVKANPRMRIPIIGNGDINSPQKAAEAFDKYGVDGIMVGRASFGHPWIFREIKHYLETGEELPPLSVKERVELAKRQMGLSLDLKGPVTGVYEMRRHLSCYFKGLPDFRETRIRLVTEPDAAKVLETLDYIAQRWGDEPLKEQASVYGL